MQQGDAPTGNIDRFDVAHQARAATFDKSAADQKIAIAVREADCDADVAQATQAVDDDRDQRRVVIVADIGLEYIPEQVQRLTVCRDPLAQRVDKRSKAPSSTAVRCKSDAK